VKDFNLASGTVYENWLDNFPNENETEPRWALHIFWYPWTVARSCIFKK